MYDVPICAATNSSLYAHQAVFLINDIESSKGRATKKVKLEAQNNDVYKMETG